MKELTNNELIEVGGGCRCWCYDPAVFPVGGLWSLGSVSDDAACFRACNAKGWHMKSCD